MWSFQAREAHTRPAGPAATTAHQDPLTEGVRLPILVGHSEHAHHFMALLPQAAVDLLAEQALSDHCDLHVSGLGGSTWARDTASHRARWPKGAAHLFHPNPWAQLWAPRTASYCGEGSTWETEGGATGVSGVLSQTLDPPRPPDPPPDIQHCVQCPPGSAECISATNQPCDLSQVTSASVFSFADEEAAPQRLPATGRG